MEKIQELLGRLADLTDAEIAELEGLVLSEFDSVESQDPTNDSVEQMVSLADALDEVRGETSRRSESADALSAKRAEVSARVHGTDTAEADAPAEADAEQPPESEMASKKPDDESDPAEALNPDEATEPADPNDPSAPAPEDVPLVDPTDQTVPDVEDAAPEDNAPPGEDVVDPEADAAEAPGEDAAESPDGETPPADGPPGETDEEKRKRQQQSQNSPVLSEQSESADEPRQENLMTAEIDSGAGVVITPPADALPVPAQRGEGVNLTITAGADIPGYGTGSTLDSMDAVAEAFAKRLHTLRNAQGNGVQHVIATLQLEYPESRRLGGEGAENVHKIQNVVSPKALAAAAGICSPLENYFDMEVCGVDDRPIRDCLPKYNADRGGLKIYPMPQLTPPVGGFWDPANPTVKTCIDATCPTPYDVYLYAIYICMKFSNYTSRFFPEVIKANTDLAMIYHARMAELNLISQMAKLLTAGQAKDVPDMGLTRALIRAISDAAAYLRQINRLDTNGPIRVILPNWVMDAMIADIAQQMPGDGLETMSMSAAQITALFTQRGINITWSLDNWDANGNPAPGPTTPGQGFETTLSFPMYPEGAFLYLDGGTLDLGVQRDMTMISENEYATFAESFEGLAKIGCDGLWMTMNVCVSGAAGALVQSVC
jgi:hypothetical protein